MSSSVLSDSMHDALRISYEDHYLRTRFLVLDPQLEGFSVDVSAACYAQCF